MDYEKLRAALTALTDENIGWIALAIRETVKQCRPNHGFTKESTANWEALGVALEELLGDI